MAERIEIDSHFLEKVRNLFQNPFIYFSSWSCNCLSMYCAHFPACEGLSTGERARSSQKHLESRAVMEKPQ